MLNGKQQFTLECGYSDLEEVLRVELGMDYLTKTIFEMDGFFSVPLLYGDVSYKKEARYILLVITVR